MHRTKVTHLQNQIAQSSKLFVLKNENSHESNQTRKSGYKKNKQTLSIEKFTEIISIDPVEKRAVVEPRVTFEQLVSATLSYNLIPLVVPEFKGITVGGAFSGSALESSSHQIGQFSDTILELEVLLGNGEIVRANQNAASDLFWGLSGSFGTLGIILSLTVKLTDAKPNILLTVGGLGSFQETMIFQQKKVLLGGELSDSPATFEHSPFKPWFFKRAGKLTEGAVFSMPLEQYLFRHDRGAFWMASTLFLPRVLGTARLYRWLHRLPRGLFEKNFVVQDFYLPHDKIEEFLSEIKIFPLWLCGVKGTDKPQLFSPHFGQERLIDVGVYGLHRGRAIEETKRLERLCTELGGRKMLYAYNYFSKEEFWKIYPEDKYRALRRKYYADGAFPSIEDKVL